MRTNKIVTAIISASIIMLAFTTSMAQACERGFHCQEFAGNGYNAERHFATPIYNSTSYGGQHTYERRTYPYGQNFPDQYTYNTAPFWKNSTYPANPYDPRFTSSDRIEEKRNAAAQDASDSTPVFYEVQAGDTLYRIAQFFETTAELLMLENYIADPTKVQVGQKLTIPAVNKDVATWIEQDSNEIGQVFHATLTAYTAGYESTGKTPSHPAYGITSSGEKVKENHTIAVDPKLIPIGSLVYIEGIGIRRAEDTGSAIKGAKIDVYIPDVKEARKFGVKKNVKVYVLDSKTKGKTVSTAAASKS